MIKSRIYNIIIVEIKQIFKTVFPFTVRFLYISRVIQYNNSPQKLANKLYKRVFDKDINWKNPKNLIEKNLWMSFNSNTELWSELADKYKVREYIAKQGFAQFLPNLYGTFHNANEINYDTLPNSFVLKTNNACGTVILVDDKSKIDQSQINKRLNKWLKHPYGKIGAEPHYLRIEPKIIIEEFLSNNSDKSGLTDYKVLCFHGLPKFILIVSERDIINHKYKLDLYNEDWVSLKQKIKNNYVSVNEFSKPTSLNKMFEVCRTLAKNIPFVRIDFYEINNQPIIGELTFTTGYGYFTEEFYDELGSYLDLNRL